MRDRMRLRTRDDQGSSILEFTGFLPLLLFVGMATIQLGIVGYSVQQAATGARAAARSESLESGTGTGAGEAAMSGWVSDRTGFANSGCPDEDADVTVTATVGIASVVPFVGGFGEVDRTVTMPCD
jgi:Flp pilus assembly protein TadG